MNKLDIRKIVTTGLLMALVVVAIFFIKIPAGNGYIHIADSFILLSAMLGPFYGLVAGGVGTMLADILTGYAAYAPWSLVVHGLQGLLMALAIRKLLSRPDPKMFFILGFVISVLTVVLGYGVAEWVMSGSFQVALATVLPNMLQVTVGTIVGALLYMPFRKILELGRSKE